MFVTISIWTKPMSTLEENIDIFIEQWKNMVTTVDFLLTKTKGRMRVTALVHALSI